jgi:ABC-type multidrug transport system fused ATPase/permease subunit
MAIIFHTLPKSFMQTTFSECSPLLRRVSWLISIIVFFQVPTDIGIIVSGAKYAAGFVPFLFLTIYFIQFFYLRTSRQLRLLDLEARASLVTHFSETAAGIQHVRAFHWQRYFVWQCLAFLDYSQRPYYYMFCIQAWLNLVLDLTIAGTAVLVVGFALSFTNTTSEAALGLSMVNIITLSSRISGFLRSWVDMETALGAISRSRDFIKNTPIETIEKRKKVDDFWPQAGRIVVRKVTASYK